MIRKIHEKCKTCNGFCGQCHAGLGEYVVPIVCDDNILGSLNLGFFQLDEESTRRRILRVCTQSPHLDFDTAIRLYQENIVSSKLDVEAVLPVFHMAAEYLAYTYKLMKTTHQVNRLGTRYQNSSEDTIISLAVDYIRQHYNQKITAPLLSEYCHCSTTYLSRIFKKRTGVNLNLYINKIRIEISKHDLLMSSDSISDIALNVGFNDPNYYCRVFNQLMGISPSEFRRRFHRDHGPGLR